MIRWSVLLHDSDDELSLSNSKRLPLLHDSTSGKGQGSLCPIVFYHGSGLPGRGWGYPASASLADFAKPWSGPVHSDTRPPGRRTLPICFSGHFKFATLFDSPVTGQPDTQCVPGPAAKPFAITWRVIAWAAARATSWIYGHQNRDCSDLRLFDHMTKSDFENLRKRFKFKNSASLFGIANESLRNFKDKNAWKNGLKDTLPILNYPRHGKN